MKKKKLTMIIALFFIAMDGAWGQNSQWDYYNSIANWKHLKLYIPDESVQLTYRSSSASGNQDDREYGLEMVFYGDYTVKLYYRHPWQINSFGGLYADFTMSGTGQVVWQNEHMVLQLNVNKEGNGAFHTLKNDNEITMEPISESEIYIFDLEWNDNCINIKGKDIIANRWYYTYNITDGTKMHPVIYTDRIILSGTKCFYDGEQKTQSELNAETSDVYGKWQWNEDRSVIYLESTTKDAILVLWKDGDNRWWGFQMANGTQGYKTETAESGQDLAYLMLSFDGASEQSFAFLKLEEPSRTQFYSVQYDRFMGIMKYDTSVLGQMKDKRTLILSYKQNGAEKTAMFQLEGLEAIYNAITQ